MNKNRRGAVLTRPFTENNTKSSYFSLFKMVNIEQFSNNNSQFSNNNSGITLIALVVTIVVLLILAGVSINLVEGGDGIISKASKAVDETVKASMKEQIEMYVSEATYDYYLNNPDNKSYLEFMAEYLENNPNMRSNENVDIVVQDDAELILNYTQGKNVVQMSLSDDGIVDVVGSGTTEGEFEDTYAPKVSYDASTTSSITVTLKDASGVVAYACLTSSTKPEADSADWVTIAEAQTKQVTITGLTGNQTYYVFAKDKAGNISEGKVCKTIDYEEIKFTTVQNGSNFTVTVTAPTDTSNIVYQIGDDGTQTQYTGAFLVPSGKTVFIWNVENKDATLKSKALFANVTVTYNANGGEGELPENLVTQHKQTVTVDSSKVLTKTGYTFLGWALTDDATAGISSFEAPATNTTLYAVWSIKSYTLTYNANGGSGSVPEQQTANYASTVEVNFDTVPSKYGYTFLGWSTDPFSTTPTYTSGYLNTIILSEDVTLYAIWNQEWSWTETNADGEYGIGAIVSYGQERFFVIDGGYNYLRLLSFLNVDPIQNKQTGLVRNVKFDDISNEYEGSYIEGLVNAYANTLGEGVIGKELLSKDEYDALEQTNEEIVHSYGNGTREVYWLLTAGVNNCVYVADMFGDFWPTPIDYIGSEHGLRPVIEIDSSLIHN